MFVVKNLLRRRVRTALSVMGVAIGIAAIVAFTSIGDGFKSSLNTYFRESEAHVVAFSDNVSDMAFSRVTQEEKKKIQSVEGVREVSEATFFVASTFGLNAKGALPVLFLFGRDPGSRLITKYENKDFQGTLFQKPDEVMLGFLAAENLGKKAGDKIRILKKEYTISAVYKTGATWENGAVVVHNSVIQDHLKMADAFSIGFIYLDDPRMADRVMKEIMAGVPGLRAVRAGEVTNHFSEQLQYIDWFVWIVSLVSVIVGGLGVLNTMIMSVSERTREIGTLRAVGWSRPMVLKLILMEGFIISVVGGLFGMVCGVLGAEVIIHFAPSGMVHTVYPPELFLRAAIVAGILGFVGSLYPAWQASRLSPIEALKYE